MGTAGASYAFRFATRRRDPDPKSAALLVIDMQNYFSSIAKPILPAVKATIQVCRNAGIPVIFTRHRHRSPEDHGMLGEWWSGDLIFDGTPESELMQAVERRDGDRVVEKDTYSAFHSTQLEALLRESGRTEVIVSGVMTNLCCETTARDAFLRGFRVFLSADATATSSQEMHEATLRNLGFRFAYLVDCRLLQRVLGS